MKVWHKILVAPGVAIIFLMVLGAVSYMGLTRQHAALSELFNSRLGNYQLVAESAQAITEVHSSVYRLFTWINNLKEDKVKQITNEQIAKIDGLIKTITAFGARPELDAGERKLAENAVKQLVKYRKLAVDAIEMSTVDINLGMASMQTADDSFQAMNKDFNELVSIEKRLAQQSYDSAGAEFSRLLVELVVILVLGLAISVSISAFMSRMIVRPLRHAIKLAGRIAGGDLTSEIKVVGRDETAELLRALSDMNASLQKIVSEVRGSTNSISSASQQIANGNADLSQRTEEQASSLEETAS